MVTGETIRLLRNWKQLKQQTVAERLGISQPAYSKIERSETVSKENIERLLPALRSTREEMKACEKLFSGKNS